MVRGALGRIPGLWKVRDNHEELVGTKYPATFKEILYQLKRVCGKKYGRNLAILRSHASELEPYSILNIDYRRAKKDCGRYPGGIEGPKYQALMNSIRKHGVLKPVIAHDLPEFHSYWRKGKRVYKPDCYLVKEGGHRVCSCQILNVPVLAIILELQTPEQGG